ncbi:MAG: AAA family ATPase [Candidatus Aenigmarchaeota archaeon]|nr:AAA family ATPase [Candidatus Aenigmarchaeota archaeon]
MNVLITGVQNMVKDTVVKLAMGKISGKVKLKALSFSDFVEDYEDPALEIPVLHDIQQKLTKNIQIKMLESKAGEHHIINGYCTVDTRLGYIPIVTKESLAIFRPDMIALIEVDPTALGSKLRDRDRFQEHKAVERSCALFCSAWSGSGIRIIRTGPEGSRKGAEELSGLLKEMLEGK